MYFHPKTSDLDKLVPVSSTTLFKVINHQLLQRSLYSYNLVLDLFSVTQFETNKYIKQIFVICSLKKIINPSTVMVFLLFSFKTLLLVYLR